MLDTSPLTPTPIRTFWRMASFPGPGRDYLLSPIGPGIEYENQALSRLAGLGIQKNGQLDSARCMQPWDPALFPHTLLPLDVVTRRPPKNGNAVPQQGFCGSWPTSTAASRHARRLEIDVTLAPATASESRWVCRQLCLSGASLTPPSGPRGWSLVPGQSLPYRALPGQPHVNPSLETCLKRRHHCRRRPHLLWTLQTEFGGVAVMPLCVATATKMNT